MYSVYKNIRKRVGDSPNFGKLLGRILLSVLILMLLSALLSPLVLIFFNTEINWIPGNPRPIYFYDIESGCDYRIECDDCNPETNIVMALDSLTGDTNVRFQRLPYPLALMSGGLSYYCDSRINYTEKSEDSGVLVSIISWNRISLRSVDEGSILHQTLHVLGFGHSADPSSVMHQNGGDNAEIDPGTLMFIRTFYTNNIFAYLNLIPLNILYALLFVYIFVHGIVRSIAKLIRIQMTKHALD